MVLKVVEDVLAEIIKWPGMVFKDCGEWLNISEWSVLGIRLAIAIIIFSIFRNKK